MKTNVTFRHLKPTPELQQSAIDACERFEKFYDGIIGIDVVFINDISRQVEFAVKVNGNTLVVKEESEDFFKSLNSAENKMVRQLKKKKTKEKTVKVLL